jgi:predicted chitinase
MGSEVNEMHKIQETLRYSAFTLSRYRFPTRFTRDEVAPEFVPPKWPHGVKQSSTNNTPIESFWRWLRDGDGHSVKMTIQQGAATGIFLPHDSIHR